MSETGFQNHELSRQRGGEKLLLGWPSAADDGESTARTAAWTGVTGRTAECGGVNSPVHGGEAPANHQKGARDCAQAIGPGNSISRAPRDDRDQADCADDGHRCVDALQAKSEERQQRLAGEADRNRDDDRNP